MNQIFISTSDEYNEAIVDLKDYLDNKDFTFIEQLGIIEIIKSHILNELKEANDEEDD